MKKKRQKSAKHSRKNKRHQTIKNQPHATNQATPQPPLVSSPPSHASYPLPPGTFISLKLIAPTPTAALLTAASLNLTKFFFSLDTTTSIRRHSLDDKSKHLHNIHAKVLALLRSLATPSQPPLSSIKPPPQPAKPQLRPQLFSKSNPDITQTNNLISFNASQFTQSCANIYLESCQKDNHSPKNEPTTRVAKTRPSYIIERDCHIFGGCVDDNADDEFFISSGAVYQSWPYVYEPGFRSIRLPHRSAKHLSVSDERIDYFLEKDTGSNPGSSMSSHALPSYYLDNYGINLFHTKREHASNNSTFSAYSSSAELSGSGESTDDDSESYRAYKRRHAVGLANFNNNSQSSLSDLGVRKADSSSCDEVVARKGGGQNGRLTTSFNVGGVVEAGEACRWSRAGGRAGRFFSCTDNYQYCSWNNLIF
jgi:hypothetical protein